MDFMWDMTALVDPRGGGAWAHLGPTSCIFMQFSGKMAK